MVLRQLSMARATQSNVRALNPKRLLHKNQARVSHFDTLNCAVLKLHPGERGV